MKEEKRRVVVTVLTVMLLIIIFSGVTYAYFTATNNQGSTSLIKVNSGKMIITYNDGTDDIKPVTDIIPTNAILVNKTFSLTGTNTTTGITTGDGLVMPYKVGLKYTSTFSDDMLYYYIKEVNRVNTSKVVVEYTGEENQIVQGNETYTGYSKGTLKKGNRYTEMVTGEFPASDKDQTITFNLKIQFPDNNDNQDSEKGKTINGKIEINHEIIFANDGWSDIADNVKAGKGNLYPVGSEKEVEIDGTNYTVRVANNTTPDECSGTDFSQTACGFVVEFVDVIYNNRSLKGPAGTNAGGWPTTSEKIFANGNFFNNLPEELQNVIIDTKVISGHGSTSGETNFTSTDKIYLLSAHEIWEDSADNKDASTYDTSYYQTRQLDYYKSKGVTTSNYLGAIKQYNNFSSTWWLRSPYYDNHTSYFIRVDYNGYLSRYGVFYTSGFSPAFRIG